MTRTFIRQLAIPVVFLALAPAATEQKKPNFIVILTDDQGWGDLGVQGSPDIRTPNIDRLAAEAQRMRSAGFKENPRLYSATPSRRTHRNRQRRVDSLRGVLARYARLLPATSMR